MSKLENYRPQKKSVGRFKLCCLHACVCVCTPTARMSVCICTKTCVVVLAVFAQTDPPDMNKLLSLFINLAHIHI